ncbi:MAG: hypothetical protein QOH91_3652 [Mycobacterium sp.]|nr:hypothetical protein [Mycobacterium sp.]
MRRIITISGVASAVLLAGYGGSDFPTTPAVMQGTPVTDAGLTMTVTNTTLGNVSQQIGIGALCARKIWVIVKLHVSNDSDKPELFDPTFQLLFVDGREYEPNPYLAESVGDKAISAATLGPGCEPDVVLAFDVSDAPAYGKYPDQRVPRGDLYSPGAVVNLTTS